MVCTVFSHPFMTGDEEENLNIKEVIKTKGERGHNINIFKRPGWREEVGEELRMFIDEGLI